MSDLLQAAAAVLDTPEALVQRSAAARAEANGTTVDEILAAWAGGDAPTAPAPSEPAPSPETKDQTEDEVAEAEPDQPEPTATAVAEPAPPPPAPGEAVEAEPEPEVELEPVALGLRLRTAIRVGAWTGSSLGLVGFLVASAAWAPSAAAPPESGPVVQVDSTGVLIAVTLVSILFGAVVAGVSRAATEWANPAMRLTGSKASTTWIGAALGLVLGVVAGVMLISGFGTEIEGAEGLVQLPVLPTLFVTLVGGGVLGGATAAVPQLLGTPVAIDEADRHEVTAVRTRLANAISIPLAGALLLVLLVLPFAFALLQSELLASGGAALVAILTAGGILGFAALAGTKPEIRISFGELMVAVAGIGTVLLIILAALFFGTAD